MTTTTVTKPPTEEDIRASVLSGLDQRMESSYPGDKRAALRGLIGEVADGLDEAAFLTLDAGPEWHAPDLDKGLWRDLRRTEAERLRQFVTEGIDRAAKRCEAIILDELTAAGLAFAQEYPEAPRGE